MTIITTRLTVTHAGTISTTTPIPAGEHLAAITLAGQPPALPANLSQWLISRSLTAPGITAHRSAARTCMATMDAEPAFVDTNVLVYASQKRSAFYPAAAAWLEAARRERRPLWISRQILRAYLAMVTRP